jgi:NTE family protein
MSEIRSNNIMKFMFFILCCGLLNLAWGAESSVDLSLPNGDNLQVESILNAVTPAADVNNSNATSGSATLKSAAKKPPLVIGLALGGGAAKGFAHIGVIKALEDNGIKPQIVTGTSAGSLVGSLYAYGYTSPQLQQISYQMDELSLADFTFSSNGVIKGNRLQQFIDARVKNTPLQKLKLKFVAVATDMDSGQSIGFNDGDTGVAVRASCSIPNIFQPVVMNGHRYVDGGLSAPVPVSYAKTAGATFVIAVDISAKPQKGVSGYLGNFDQTINIMGEKLLNAQLKQADIVIHPDISQLSSFSFDTKQEAINLGYQAAMAQMPLIKAKLALYKKSY